MVTVREVMKQDVVSVPTGTSARNLARLLVDEEISGVPVVDGEGRCVGVVSQTDLVRLAADEAEIHLTSDVLRVGLASLEDPDGDPQDADPFGFFLPEDSPFDTRRFLDTLPESDFDTITVDEIMTPVSFSVAPTTSVIELAEFLVRGRIHRAVVVDGERLVGIVTSNDVLRAVAEGLLTA